MPEIEYKRCSKCEETKPLNEFHRDKRLKSGLRCACKDCGREQQRAWTQKNRELVNARVREWRAKNPDKAAAIAKRYYERNKDEIAAKQRRWEQDNPEKRSQQRRRRHERIRGTGKHRARQELHEAVRWGRIVKPSACEDCGEQFEKHLIQGHHADHSKPLDVEWLCRPCHEERHTRNGR